MAFPVTPVLDSFGRANENPLANGNWSGPTYTGDAQGKLDSNTAVSAGAAWGGSYWSAALFAGDNEVHGIYATVSGYLNFYLHWTPVALNGYAMAAGAGSVEIARYTAGSVTSLQTTSVTVATNDAFGLERIGNNLRAWRKPSGGSWGAVAAAVSDATYNSGRIGFELSATAGRLDSFGGGQIIAKAPYRRSRLQAVHRAAMH